MFPPHHHQKWRSTAYLVWQVCYPKFPRSLFRINLLYDKSLFLKTTAMQMLFFFLSAASLLFKYHQSIWVVWISEGWLARRLMITSIRCSFRIRSLCDSTAEDLQRFAHHFRQFAGISQYYATFCAAGISLLSQRRVNADTMYVITRLCQKKKKKRSSPSNYIHPDCRSCGRVHTQTSSSPFAQNQKSNISQAKAWSVIFLNCSLPVIRSRPHQQGQIWGKFAFLQEKKSKTVHLFI